MNKLVLATSTNPYSNLGLEDYLFDTSCGEVTLYLWQNSPTVVIGRNQNPYKECNLEKMEEDKVFLARRKTGGGAVYHSLGNLNYSFIAPPKIYDKDRQFSVILSALSEFDIYAEKSGRNDLCVDGKKISGNAFRNTEKVCLHHGTLLVEENPLTISKYLNVSKEKLLSKGVDSVRSRVICLKELNFDITPQTIAPAIVHAFIMEYGHFDFTTRKAETFSTYSDFYADKNWIFGKTPPFTTAFHDRFSFGEIDLLFNVVGNKIASITVFTDSLDPLLSAKLERALYRIPFDAESIKRALISIGLNAENSDNFIEKLISQLF